MLMFIAEAGVRIDLRNGVDCGLSHLNVFVLVEGKIASLILGSLTPFPQFQLSSLARAIFN